MIKYSYDTQSDIPEKFRELYEEKDGRYVLSKVEGARGADEITKIMNVLDKERKEHAYSKKKMKDALGNMDLEEARELLDSIKNQESGKPDLDSILTQKMAPMQRERDKLMRQIKEAQDKIQEYETKNRQRAIRDAITEVARKNKVYDTAIEDVALIAERIFDVNDAGDVLSRDGLRADEWISDMKTKKPHWFPQSTGGGATGSGAFGDGIMGNPWTAKNWNMTEQAQILLRDKAVAERLAMQAGTTVGGLKPEK